MKSFAELMEIADLLNSPEGCPWDVEQTFESLRNYVIEEAHEVVDAVDKKDWEELMEELGDLFYTVIFYAKVAEREKKFTMPDILEALKSKLVRRHPHVFGDASNQMEEIVKNWEKIKAVEKKERKSALDGIPKTLPTLLRAQKIIKRMKKKKANERQWLPQTEGEMLAAKILGIAYEATEKGIDLESNFRELMSREENSFKEWELKDS